MTRDEREASERGALTPLRVLDLTHYVAGPYCTKLLAGFGAEVIKIERPGSGDPLRSVGPFVRDHEGNREASIPFLWLNTGKKSVTLNLKQPKGAELLRRLVEQADLLLENFSPGVMSRLGLGWEALHAINPRLIVTSISNFGQTGPYRDYMAEEIQAYAMSGLMFETGDPSRPPLAGGPAIAQYSAAMVAYTGTMTALLHRGVTGGGQHVDVSIQEAALVHMEMSLVECLQLGRVRQRRDDRHWMVPWELYECADGQVGVIGGPLRHWWRAAEIFPEPRLFAKKFEHSLDRMTQREEYESLLKPLVKSWKKRELFQAGQERRLGFTYLADLDDAMASPQHEARGFFADMDHPVAGRHRYANAPFRMSATPWSAGRAPMLGEHNRDVYGALLSLTEADLESSGREGVI